MDASHQTPGRGARTAARTVLGPLVRGRCPAFLKKDRIVAPPSYNRWRVASAAIAIHLCIGSVYSWSIFNSALVKEHGVVTSASDDWSIQSVVWVFMVAIGFLGISAAVAGKWLERVGPRLVGVAAALLWSIGIIVGGVGVHLHQLWLLYLGYGALGGCGLGLGYVSPVSTLIRWFPDRRGMATGLAIMGFGGGAIIGATLKEFLLKTFYESPQYLGTAAAVPLITTEGRRFAQVGGRWVEVVVASAADVPAMIAVELEGVYVVGTGSTGAAQTFFVMGFLYLLVMMAAAWLIRVPAEEWRPQGWSGDQREQQLEPSFEGMSGSSRPVGRLASLLMRVSRRRLRISREDVHLNEALKTPQFYLLWVALCLNVTAGIGVISVAKTMMIDIFGSTMPDVVTPSFAAAYVLMISVFNMLGRFAWALISDHFGTKNTFYCFFALGALLYLSIPIVANSVSVNPLVTWLVIFYAVTMLAFTIYGGGFATVPAYLADVFGTLHVGAIHGRLLTAWSVAGVVGPLAMTSLRDFSEKGSIREIAAQVDPADFEAKFGAHLGALEELIAARTVTISKLMEIAPAGTVDPTPGVYNLTMFVMAGLLTVAFFANMAIRPVAHHHHLSNTHPCLAAQRARSSE